MTTELTRPTRRRFFEIAAAGVASAVVSATLRAQSPIRRVGGPLLKLGVNAYSFLNLLNENQKDSRQGIDLFGVCDFCAKHNIEAVDLTGYFFPGYPEIPDAAYLNRIKRHAHACGLIISGTGIKNDFATADKSVRDEGVRLTKRWIEVAARLGAPVIRVFAGPQGKSSDWKTLAGGASREAVEGWMADALRECAIHGEEYGVLIGVQNHGDFLSTGPEHLSLLKRVDHTWCGALVDTGKYLTPDPYADIAMMVPHAVNWQIKETLGSSLQSPPADYLKLATIISGGGYRGFVPIETLAMGRKDYDPYLEVEKVIVAMRQAIAQFQPVAP